MINIDFNSESVWHGLALHRYYIHIDEVKRVLTPVLEEVYRVAYDRGIADQINAVTNHKLEVPQIFSQELSDDQSSKLRELTAEEMNKIEPDNYFPVEEQ